MEKTREAILISRYGFNKGSYKYIPAGSEILKYIGQVVILVDYEKKNDVWETQTKRVTINSITDFDPMTMTYLMKYQDVSEGSEVEEVRIIPEGYSWGNPEETGKMKRFLPYSLHAKLVEDELFFSRLSDLWNSRETMSLDSISTIAVSKDRDSILKYQHNIGALVKMGEDFLWIRLIKIGLTHKVGTQYKLKFGDINNSWTLLVDKSDKDYDFESGLGRIKIIDLMG